MVLLLMVSNNDVGGNDVTRDLMGYNDQRNDFLMVLLVMQM